MKDSRNVHDLQPHFLWVLEESGEPSWEYEVVSVVSLTVAIVPESQDAEESGLGDSGSTSHSAMACVPGVLLTHIMMFLLRLLGNS